MLKALIIILAGATAVAGGIVVSYAGTATQMQTEVNRAVKADRSNIENPVLVTTGKSDRLVAADNGLTL